MDIAISYGHYQKNMCGGRGIDLIMCYSFRTYVIVLCFFLYFMGCLLHDLLIKHC